MVAWRNIFMLSFALLLSGCYESSDVKIHEPGQYKGKTDSTAVMQPNDDQLAALRERFKTVQTDR